MTKQDFMNKASRTIHNFGFKLKKHSPEILVATGIVTGLTGAVLACKATLKVDEVLEDAKENIDKINMVAEDETKKDIYTEQDKARDLTVVYAQTGVKLAKLYAPAIVCGVVSVTCVLAGTNILRKRNAAIAAAYAITEKGFKEYRERVVDRFGERVDHELRHNIKAKTIETITVDEDGNEVVTKETVDVIDKCEFDQYTRIYDDGNTGWTKDPEVNKMVLLTTQSYFNRRLVAKGKVFLNEVYDYLGYPITEAGSRIGWLYNSDYPDGHIDFGLFDVHCLATRNFVNGYERSVILDFNVDGDVWALSA